MRIKFQYEDETKKMTINDKEMRTVLAVFSELLKKPYNEINTFLGSLTIDEMQELYWKIRNEYFKDEQE